MRKLEKKKKIIVESHNLADSYLLSTQTGTEDGYRDIPE